MKLTAAQSGPWLRPATYRPSRIDAATYVEYPARGRTKETQTKTNEFKANEAESPLKKERSSQQEGQSKKTGPRGTKLIGRPE